MARLNTYVELDGPLFDPEVVKRFKAAVGAEIEAIGDDAAGIMMGFVAAGGFVKTGRLLRSVTSEFRQTPGLIGYAKVYPTDVWPEPDRPTRTWISRGVRRGVKLRKAYDIFGRTTTRVKQQGVQQRVADAVQKVLE